MHTHTNTHHTALTDNPFDVRLAGGSLPGTGRVEILYGGVWGTVCSNSWDISDAHVVCRQLGYVGATMTTSSAAYGEGEGVIWMDDVSCIGNETRSVMLCNVYFNAQRSLIPRPPVPTLHGLGMRLCSAKNTLSEFQVEVREIL